ncbi:MAG: substrate-binding domain-containing protein [Ferruginibacter sp.]
MAQEFSDKFQASCNAAKYKSQNRKHQKQVKKPNMPNRYITPPNVFHLSFGILCFLFASCQLPVREKNGRAVSSVAGTLNTPDAVNEEYIMITAAVNLPLYVHHEQTAFKNWGRQMGVKTTVLGNEEWDVQKIVEIIEQVIHERPTGLLINGTDPGLATAINKVADAGIPVVVYDSEIEGSHPNCFIGSDWYSMGYKQGERVVQLTGGKGKVACLGILGMSNQEAGMQGLQDALKQSPGITFIGKYNDAANLETAAKVTSDVITANPGITAICGFTSATGPGIALAVREAGKTGKIKVTTVDFEPEHLKLIQDGVIQYTVGQKRELFGSYGAQLLFDRAHRKNLFSNNDPAAGVNPMPVHVNTGLIEIDQSNVKYFIY